MLGFSQFPEHGYSTSSERPVFTWFARPPETCHETGGVVDSVCFLRWSGIFITRRFLGLFWVTFSRQRCSSSNGSSNSLDSCFSSSLSSESFLGLSVSSYKPHTPHRNLTRAGKTVSQRSYIFNGTFRILYETVATFCGKPSEKVNFTTPWQ